ncbi:MAG: AAA family ATPase, partial [Thiogranum sp.]
AHAFDLHPEDRSKANLLLELERFLNQQSYRGHRTILIVDEAQSLSPSALEELRLLANMQRNHQLLLQIFLVGQEKLLDLIRAPGMEQLQQRLVAASVLEPLDLDETVDYVEHRLCLVAWQGDPAISEEALRLVHRYSGGVPRRINMICNRLFLYGGMQQKHELRGEDARTVIAELHEEFLLPAEQPGEDGDGQPANVEPSPEGAGTPVRSLPRGKRTAKETSRPSDQRSSAAQDRQRRAKNTPPRSQSGQEETARFDREARDSRTPRRPENRPGRAATGFNRQSIGKAGRPAARRVRAAEPDSQQRKGKFLRVTAAGLFLLAGSLLAVMLVTDTSLDGLLKVAGFGESRDTFKTLSKTGVHKAVKVFPDNEEANAPESQSGQPEPEPAAAEVSPNEPVPDRARLTGTAPTAPRPETPIDEVEKPIEPMISNATTSVTKDAEKDGAMRPGRTEQTETSDDGVETVSAPPSAAMENATKSNDVEPKDDDKSNAAAIEEEYGKLRRVAGERYSQRRIQTQSEPEKVASSRRNPPAPTVAARTSVSPASEPKVSTTDVSAPKVSLPESSIPKSPIPTVSVPKTSVPNASVPKASVPKVSVPKVSAPKTSQPKITVAAATTAATPGRGTKKSALSRNKIRSALLEGQWTSQGKPASLLPSEITFCNSQGEERIGCWSVAQNINTKYGPALYKVETTLKGFSDGSFSLSYRTLVKLVDASATDGAKEKAAASKDGWQVTEHSMQCQLTQADRVMCRDKKGVTRNYQRSESKGRI